VTGVTRIAAGLDVGSLWTKAVAVVDGAVRGHSIVSTGDGAREAAREALREALAALGASPGDVPDVVVTGAGAKRIDFAPARAADVMCLARGAAFVHPAARIVLDLGAESTRAVRIDERGDVVEYALNDKCAAGAGVFLDAIAAVLRVPLDEVGPLSLRSTADVEITSMCVAFAESEVVSLVHRRTPKEDILRGLHRSIAARIHGLASRVGGEGETLAVGGMALNAGIRACLEARLKRPVAVPESPRIVGALGAALLAAERGADR